MKKDHDFSDREVLSIIQKIHKSRYKIVLSVTGGGSGAFSELLMHGSGSSTLLEAIVPYSKNALAEFIGKEPETYCSEETAREMAMASFERALKLCDKNTDTHRMIGIGVTCKLVKKDDEREGREHDIYIASQSATRTSTAHLKLLENRSRETEEKISSLFIIHFLAQLCEVDAENILPLPMIPEFANTANRSADVSEEIGELLVNTLLQGDEAKKRAINLSNSSDNSHPEERIVFAGSFNPCHSKHVEIAKTAFKKYGSPVCFEISLANVDKPPIDFISLQNRLDSLREYDSEEFMGDIYLTNAPFFANKAVLFPESCFLIGADTLKRTFNEKYYREGETKESLLEHFSSMGVHFMVFHRKNIDISMDDDIKQIFKEVELSEYEDDGTSSTKIRKGRIQSDQA